MIAYGQFSSRVCVGIFGLTYSLHHPRGGFWLNILHPEEKDWAWHRAIPSDLAIKLLNSQLTGLLSQTFIIFVFSRISWVLHLDLVMSFRIYFRCPYKSTSYPLIGSFTLLWIFQMKAFIAQIWIWQYSHMYMLTNLTWSDTITHWLVHSNYWGIWRSYF